MNPAPMSNGAFHTNKKIENVLINGCFRIINAV